jgi:hypothetical protein
VADGHANPIFKTSPRTLHVPLPHANADYGNTPRVIGAMLADSYGFDAIAFLDADNWFEPVHLERMAAALNLGKTPLVSCKRTFRHLDGSVLPCTELDEERFTHVDTNCWLVTRPAFSLLPIWRIPKWAAIMGDRVFLEHARRERFAITETQLRTVNYRTKYVNHYRLAGIPSPAGVYTGNDLVEALRHLRSLAGAAEMAAAIGFYPLIDLPQAPHAPAAPALVPASTAP